ncbi:MAG TPA: phasin family protein [Acetobacteraceae bacterium]|nr:phasin family protein [Acetobacteraceae bacterium]
MAEPEEIAGRTTRAGARTVRAAADAGAQAVGAGAEAARAATEAGTRMMGEFTRMLSEMKLPAMPDVQSLMAAHRRNLETLSAANRVALEGAQAVARRHMEIMQQTMAELSETVQAVADADGPQAKAAKQAELLKRAYEHAIANMRELSDLIQRANGEALEVLNHRFLEAMDEMKALMQKAGQTRG